MMQIFKATTALAALLPLSIKAPAIAQTPTPEFQTIRAKVDDIPILVIAPRVTKGKALVIWLTGFSGQKESVEPQLREFAKHGFVALSFDPYQHGERRIEPNQQLSLRVRSNIRKYFWPILARTAEESPKVIDWAIKTLGVRSEVGYGGVSMGGDISVAAATVDKRIVVVSACVGTPDWMRPGSFEPPGEPDLAARNDYDRRNPLTHPELFTQKPAIAFQSGDVDKQVPPDGGEKLIALLKPLYGDKADRLVVNREPKMGHGFSPLMLENSIKWFEKYLKP